MSELTRRYPCKVKVMACPSCGHLLRLATVKKYWTEIMVVCPKCNELTGNCPFCGVALNKFSPDTME